jgi:hypothetical protein
MKALQRQVFSAEEAYRHWEAFLQANPVDAAHYMYSHAAAFRLVRC